MSTAPELARAAHDPNGQIRRRFARRQWARRLRLWRWVLGITLLVSLVVLGVWLVWFSRYLVVGGVQVEGTDFLSPGQVRRVAAVPVGQHLVSVDVEAIDKRVAALAPVRSVEVTKVWPDRILIRVQERVPVAVVTLGEQTRAMDADGVLFRDYARPPARLPKIRTQAAVDTESLKEAAAVLAALPADVQRKVAYLSVETIDQIRLELRDGREVLWGSAEQSADKGRVLAKLLARRAQVYDVSVPGLPTLR
ncbi:MAG: FtsQ-type POTRA domain-containing protein [Nocardioides sp.]